MVGATPEDVTVTLRMLARAVNDLYLLFSYISCAVLLRYIQWIATWDVVTFFIIILMTLDLFYRTTGFRENNFVSHAS